MKNLTKIFMMVAAGMLAFSCVTDATEDLGVTTGNGEGLTTITVSLGEPETLDTKVQFGTKDGDTYPLRWNVGDVIRVHRRVSSEPLTEASISENGKNASFTVEASIPAPENSFGVVYPDPGVTWNNSSTRTFVEAIIPPVQQYYEGNVDPNAMVLYGSLSTAGPVELRPFVGVLRIAVKGNGEVLKDLTVETLNEANINGNGFDDNGIAGGFAVYHRSSLNDKCGAREGATRTITMALPEEGLTLGEEEQVIYVAVRAVANGETQVSHGTMKVTLTDADGEKMAVTFDTTNKPIKAGFVREFTPIVFAPNVENDEPIENTEITIDSEAALVMFAKSAALYTKATVTANLDMSNVSAEDLANFPIENFGAYEFDGGNFEISNLTTPLFGTTQATIKNVKLTNVNINETARGISGAIACQINGGSLENCSATGALTISAIPSDATELYYGGLVGKLNGATDGTSIYNCVNGVNITVTATIKKVAVHLGGVASSVTGDMNTVTNNGEINFAGTTDDPLRIGGIVSVVTGDMNTVTNNGKISVAGTITDGSYLGGIVCNATGGMNSVTNNGNLSFTGATNAIALGGVASSVTGDMNTVTNNGKISFTGTTSGSVEIGGVIRKGADGQTCDECKNYGAIYINGTATSAEGDATMAGIYISGVVNEISGTTTYNDCHNYGNITVDENTLNSDSANYIGGFISVLQPGATVTLNNCSNEGNITDKGYTLKVVGIGGLSGYFNNNTAATLNVNGFINKGDITYCAKNSDTSSYLGVGGILGLMYKTINLTLTGTIANTGTIKVSEYSGKGAYTGGLFGYLKGLDKKLTSDRLINVGNIDVRDITTTANTQVGGIVGLPDAPKAYPVNAECFCDILAINLTAKATAVGMCAGRTFNPDASLYAENGKFGGRIAKTATTDTIEGTPGYNDPVTGEWVEGTEDQIVVVPTWITLDDSNFLQYLFSATVTEEQATTYNITYLSKAPTVE